MVSYTWIDLTNASEFMPSAVIVKYGDKALRQKAIAVESVDENIRQLVGNMLSAMYAAEGVGLAAEQVGRSEAVCVIDVPREEAGTTPMPLVMINPRIIESEGEQTGLEGCLSFPDIHIKVKRAGKVKAIYMGLEGGSQTVVCEGLLARAVQHELDHLEGVLLVDHMSPVQKVANAGKLKRLKRENKG